MALPQIAGGRVAVMAKGNVDTPLPFTATSAATASPVSKSTSVMRMVAIGGDCLVEFGGAAVVAKNDGTQGEYVPEGVVEYPEVTPNATYIAVIAAPGSTSGILYLSEQK